MFFTSDGILLVEHREVLTQTEVGVTPSTPSTKELTQVIQWLDGGAPEK
jgi:hypothetical protein